MPQQKARSKIVDALMALAAERPWDEVTLPALAERAGVTLAALRGSYDSRLAVLADFIRQLDERVLAGLDPEMGKEPPRERIFDILFARLEALSPHKQAIRNIGKAARGDPVFTLELNRIVVGSMRWMLAAAGIDSMGGRGHVKAQTLAFVWAGVMRVFLDDDDPGHARTMAALDKRLREVERAIVRLHRLRDCVCACLPRERREPAASNGDLPEGHPS